MASSKTYYSLFPGGNVYPNPPDYRFRLVISQLSQNQAQNKSTLRFQYYIDSYEQPAGAGRYFECGVSINGGNTYMQAPSGGYKTIGGSVCVLISTQDIEFSHDSNGKLTLSSLRFRGGYSTTSGGVTNYTWTCYSAGGTTLSYTCDDINPNPSISNSIYSKGYNYVKVSYSASNYTNIQRKLNNGSWTNVRGNPYTISGLSSATSYTVQTRAYKSSTNKYTYGSTLNFTTTAKETTPTVSLETVEIGNPIVISTPRDKSTYYHKLYYKYGSSEIVLLQNGVETSYEYTPALTMARYLTSGTASTCTIYCDTYSDNTYETQIGLRKSTTFTLTIPENVVPSCSIALTDVMTSKPSALNGLWIKSKSLLKGTITASGIQNSTISNYFSSLSGFNQNYHTNPFTTQALTVAGNRTITSTVTDSRGRTKTTTKSITVIDYDNPSIISAKVQRCDEDGTINENGTYGKITCQYNISPITSDGVNKNTKTLTVKQGNGTPQNVPLTNYSGTVTSVLFSGLSETETYNFTFTLTDIFGSTPITFALGVAYKTVSKRTGGKGIAFGKIATQDGLDCNMNATFRGTNTISGAMNVSGASNYTGTLKHNNKNVLDISHINNTLTSTSTSLALSANQGKILNELINGTVIYDGNLKAGNEISLNMTAYSRLRVYANSYATKIIFDVDLTTPVSDPMTAGYSYASSGVGFYKGATNYYEIHGCFVEINDTKTIFKNSQQGYQRQATTYERQNTDDYHVYKIVGFKY